MRKYLNAVNVTKVGEWCANVVTFIHPLAIFQLAFGVILSVVHFVGVGDNLMTISLFFYILPAITLVMYGLGKAFYRTRTISDEVFGAKYYAFITDVLRSRGIRNTKRYIEQHPDHVAQLSVIDEALTYPEFSNEHRRMFKSFLFMKDENPEKTKDAILTIVLERKIQDPKEVRAMLEEFEEKPTPLMSGAL